MEVIVWLVLLVVFLGVEAATLGLASIWFAGGSLIGLVAAALHAPVWLQIILFLITSLILLFFTRPIAVKYFNKSRAKTNVQGVIGKQAIVVSEIDNLHGVGQVTVAGQQWSARSSVEGEVIPVGAVVVVDAISGVKLMVHDITPEVEQSVPSSTETN